MIGRSRPRTHLAAVVLFLLTLFYALHGAAPAWSAALPGRRPYIPPVDAPVTDPFRAPTNPYGPGNRGIDYQTEPGTPVRAAGAGVVVFAGAVAGQNYVTILHPDGVRTSYSYLVAVYVQEGQVIAQGTILGTAGATFHVGARIGDEYIDPMTLWGGSPHVALVPLDGGAPSPALSAGAPPSFAPQFLW